MILIPILYILFVAYSFSVIKDNDRILYVTAILLLIIWANKVTILDEPKSISSKYIPEYSIRVIQIKSKTTKYITVDSTSPLYIFSDSLMLSKELK